MSYPTAADVTLALRLWRLAYGPPERRKPLLGRKAASLNNITKAKFSPSGAVRQHGFRRVDTLLKQATLTLFLHNVISFEQALALFGAHPEWAEV